MKVWEIGQHRIQVEKVRGYMVDPGFHEALERVHRELWEEGHTPSAREWKGAEHTVKFLYRDQRHKPIDEITKPKNMRTVIFNKRIARLRVLEGLIRDKAYKGLEKALNSMYRA